MTEPSTRRNFTGRRELATEVSLRQAQRRHRQAGDIIRAQPTMLDGIVEGLVFLGRPSQMALVPAGEGGGGSPSAFRAGLRRFVLPCLGPSAASPPGAEAGAGEERRSWRGPGTS